MHIRFTDTDGAVHVAPENDVYMDSDSEIGADEPLTVTVVRMDDSNTYEVSKEEFARLVGFLEGRT